MSIHFQPCLAGINPGAESSGCLDNPSMKYPGIILLFLYFILPFLFGIPVSTHGQIIKENAPLFASDDPLELTIEADFRKLVETKDDEVPYYDTATLTVTGKSGIEEFSIKVRTRGYSRRLSLCDFPPLLLNFKKMMSSEQYSTARTN